MTTETENTQTDTETKSPTAVYASVDVSCPPDRAFELFTGGINRWWHPDHHILGADLKEVRIEPFVGGGVWEESVTGETCAFGRVLTRDPPGVFAFAWLIGPDWEPPAADAPGSTVTVTFSASPTGTRVELVHRDFDVHGPGWESERAAMGAADGWAGGLRRLADLV